MEISIKNTTGNASFTEKLFGDDEVSTARLQLAYVGTVFATSWAIGSLHMAELVTANYSVPLISTLLGL